MKPCATPLFIHLQYHLTSTSIQPLLRVYILTAGKNDHGDAISQWDLISYFNNINLN